MVQKQPATQGFRPGRRMELLDDRLHDPFQDKHKLSSPSVCGSCAAVYENGRWRWGAAPADAHPTTCPACQRIAQHMPAGEIRIEGEYALAHRDELFRFARNKEAQDRPEHPMQRIMDIEEEADRIFIHTTDVHLAEGIARGLHASFGGDLEWKFSDDEHQVRIHWTR